MRGDKPMGKSATTSELDALAKDIIGCTRCPLGRRRIWHPGVGRSDSPIMLVEMAPGRRTARNRRRFTNKNGELSAAGRLLDTLLHKTLGLALDSVYLTSLVKCPLPQELAKPKPIHITHCRIHLERELLLLQPTVMLVLGGDAAEQLIPRFRKITEDRGRTLRTLEGHTVVPTYHPSFVVSSGKAEEFTKDLHLCSQLLHRRPFSVDKTSVSQSSTSPSDVDP